MREIVKNKRKGVILPRIAKIFAVMEKNKLSERITRVKIINEKAKNKASEARSKK